MITIVDYGMGNLGSIKNMLKKVGADCEITADPDRLQQAKKLILPGVGAFDAGMAKLNSSGLVPVLNEQVLEKKVPVLGICLGMQLMTQSSEEGVLAGLGWVDAKTVRFVPALGSNLKVPHMGWNLVKPSKSSPLLRDAEEEERFYFVHSYFVQCQKSEEVLLHTHYGHSFDAAFEVGNVIGVQFHPEKSHKFGMRLLRNFAEAY
jgi:glutamine amidotransferase